MRLMGGDLLRANKSRTQSSLCVQKVTYIFGLHVIRASYSGALYLVSFDVDRYVAVTHNVPLRNMANNL